MKYLTLITLLLIATFAYADLWDNCTAHGGTVITANRYGDDKGGLCNDPNNTTLTNNCNGKKFCKSGKNMNWWSAFTWCEAVGGKLAGFSSLCPNIQINPNNVAGACANIKGIASSSGGWTSTGWSTTGVLIVNPSSGGITSLGRNVNVQGNGGYGYIYALCEEK